MKILPIIDVGHLYAKNTSFWPPHISMLLYNLKPVFLDLLFLTFKIILGLVLYLIEDF